MTILRKSVVLVAAVVLVALAAPSAFAQFENPAINPEIEIPGERGRMYDGPPIPNALLARYVVFPTNEQKRRLNVAPPIEPPDQGGQDRVNSSASAEPPSRGLAPRAGERGSMVGIGGSLITPQQGAIQPKVRVIVDELEDALRDAQGELGLR